jgi:hypothetical protein
MSWRRSNQRTCGGLLGHNTLVAQKHYWRVTDADFERAAKVNPALQKALQRSEHGSASDGTQTIEARNTAAFRGVLRNATPLMGVTELESVTSTMST